MKKIIDYFGSIVQPPFTLIDAIKSGRLVEYEYLPEAIRFTVEESEAWETATKEISKNISGRLIIGVEDSLTIMWLIPKLNDFKNKFPSIEVEIMTDLYQLYIKRDGVKWRELRFNFNFLIHCLEL